MGRNFVDMQLNVGANSVVDLEAVVREQPESKPVFMGVVRCTDDLPVLQDREAKRMAAIQGWWEVLAPSISSSAVGKRVIVDATTDTLERVAYENLDAVFALKSPGTLLRRLYSIQAFASWCKEQHGECWIPVKESRTWQYTKWLQQNKAPPTKACSLLEALRFCWYILGVKGSDEALRVKGTSAQMKARKRPWRPADLLSAEEVRKLRNVLLCSDEPVGDRIICGHMLHLLYSRSRWSDLNSVLGLHMDLEGKYIELSARCHKGARSSEMKARLLPVVAPCLGIVNHNWASVYLNLRKQAQLFMPGDEPGTMMRVPLNDEASKWFVRP